MEPFTAITTAISSVKAATDIVKLLRDSDLSLEKAEIKLKLADLVGALADAKLELSEIQDQLIDKDRIITELRDAFESKDSLIRHHDAYYEIESNGKPLGIAFCLRCWEGDHKKRQLVQDAKDHKTNVCTNCGHRYHSWQTSKIQPTPS